ncbi:MAG: AIR synthase related protein, partial [Acidilobaceae archaeon]
MSEESWSYAKAGVDIAKQRRLHERALSAAKTLSKRLNVEVEGLGGYSASVKLDAYKLMLHIDGVGTKTIVLRELKSLWVAGWDCVAVNVNDVACERGRPIAIVDYVSMPDTNEEEFSQIIEGLTRAAERSRTIIVGGETAILPDLVSGIDVVCAVLAIKEGDLKDPSEGDVLVGIESNGLHANGYTLVRRVLKNKGLSYNSSISGVYFSSELTKPTAIYSNMLLEAFEKGLIK